MCRIAPYKGGWRARFNARIHAIEAMLLPVPSPDYFGTGLARPAHGRLQEKGELEPVRYPGPAKGLREMGLDGTLGDLEPGGDLLVGGPPADQVRDRSLPLGEALQTHAVEGCSPRASPPARTDQGKEFADQSRDEHTGRPDLSPLHRRHRLPE